MLNVVIAGVGGQGSVLASKILATAAQSKGWKVRTAETIGMAQRGGSVTSHVRIASEGEEVHAPLDLVIALEPGEGVRACPFLAPDGLLVSSNVVVPAVTANLAGRTYAAAPMVEYLRETAAHFELVDVRGICRQVGSSKVANVVMLAAAVAASARTGFGLGDAIAPEEFEDALRVCVKPRFIDLNLAASAAAM